MQTVSLKLFNEFCREKLQQVNWESVNNDRHTL